MPRKAGVYNGCGPKFGWCVWVSVDCVVQLKARRRTLRTKRQRPCAPLSPPCHVGGGFSDEHVAARPGDKCPYFFGCLIFHPLIFSRTIRPAQSENAAQAVSNLVPWAWVQVGHGSRGTERESGGDRLRASKDVRQSWKGVRKVQRQRALALSFFLFPLPPPLVRKTKCITDHSCVPTTGQCVPFPCL